jgi:hypothetical protein
MECENPLWLKGAVSRDGYFFESLNILISTLCGLAFHYPIQWLTLLLFASS